MKDKRWRWGVAVKCLSHLYETRHSVFSIEKKKAGEGQEKIASKWSIYNLAKRWITHFHKAALREVTTRQQKEINWKLAALKRHWIYGRHSEQKARENWYYWKHSKEPEGQDEESNVVSKCLHDVCYILKNIPSVSYIISSLTGPVQ